MTKKPDDRDYDDLDRQAAAWMELTYGPAWLSRDEALAALGRLHTEWEMFDDDPDAD